MRCSDSPRRRGSRPLTILRRPSVTRSFPTSKLRFNFGKGIKEPSTYQQANQLYALLTPAQRTQFGVGEIGPERSQGFDAGIGSGLSGTAEFELDAAYFHNRFYDLITYLDPTSLISIGVSPGAARPHLALAPT